MMVWLMMMMVMMGKKKMIMMMVMVTMFQMFKKETNFLGESCRQERSGDEIS